MTKFQMFEMQTISNFSVVQMTEFILTFYQMTKFQTGPNWKHLQTQMKKWNLVLEG